MPNEPRRFPPPWSVDDPDTKLGQDCYIVRDATGHALAYVYFEDESGRRSAAHRMSAILVRRGKAALSSGCKSHPAIAPAGSNRSSRGGDEMAEAFG